MARLMYLAAVFLPGRALAKDKDGHGDYLVTTVPRFTEAAAMADAQLYLWPRVRPVERMTGAARMVAIRVTPTPNEDESDAT